jgi:FAD/FMN-containing dehydrogenase/alkanesulfonate monooxygenase SsuD/methylene tetrahydromethanopterin reductase-like flavin-dependent oxidoreductase (luciferase family)
VSGDLGHPLQVGVELPVDPAAPDATARLARHAEELGLDLVVVPEPPDDLRADTAGLDPWTTLGWVAARTDRIALATRGLRLTDRPPAVLARAAASLDHLTSGRLTLGLATSAPAHAPAHAPAERSDRPDTPGVSGQSSPLGDMAALEEAVAVLRGMWDAADPRPLVLDGAHHRVAGAQRGPAPAHQLAVWLGGPADADRVASAARAADGWWSAPPEGAPDGTPDLALLRAEQDAVDAAVTAAGRDPREVRRGVVLDASSLGADAVDVLVALVVEAGVGTLVLAGADEVALSRFAADVLPDLRERVAGVRAARGTVVGTVRSAAVLAARRAGIDYDGIPGSLLGSAVEPGDVGYAAVRSTYMRGGRPGLVLRPASTAEVVEALAFARAQDVPLAIRSGGHGISGRSTNDGGVVIDLGRMNGIEVLDVATRRVRIEPGARWGEVAAALQPYGWALTSGDYGGVGVGGLATAGGIGFLVRQHGLTLDHLRAAEVVLADGTVVRVSAEENPDLFWGVRGAGANLGIVTSFEFEVDEVGDVGFAQLVFDATDTEQFLVDWGATVEAAPRDTTAFLIMGPPRGGQVVAQVMAMVDSDDPDTIIERLQPFALIAPLLQQQVQVVPYSAVVSTPAHHTSDGEPVTRTGMAEHLTPALAADAARLVRSGVTPFFQIRAAGGAVHDVPADATAYAHRSAHFSVVAMGSSRRRLDAVWDAMAHHFDGLYVSFETDPRPERVAEAFPGPTLQRLRELKRRYDPQDVFRHNFSVAEPPAVVV